MPFVITTNRGCNDVECHPGCRGRKISRHAVATAEEARQIAADVINEHRYKGEAHTSPMVEPYEYGACDFDDDITESLDMELGPFFDGTVIEIEHETWPDLFKMSGIEPQAIGMPPLYDADAFEYIDDVKDLIVRAYNEKNGSK